VTPRRGAPEADATRDLYERYARQIHAYCLHQLGNREEAEDAVQSTFLNAFRGLKRGIDPEFESAWLYKIAENVCLTRQRSSFRRRRVESPGDLSALQDVLPAQEIDNDELIGLPEALEEMPDQQRRALLLREWQGLSYKEIAAELDLSQAAVETLLFRARRSLASALTDESTSKKAGVARKLRGGGDAGSLLALLKTLIFSGGAKVAATVATVAATSVVVATPAVRQTVEQAVAPTHSQRATPHAVSRATARRSLVASSGFVFVSAVTPRHAAAKALAAPASHRTRHQARPAHAAGTPAYLLVGHAPRTIVEGARPISAAPVPVPVTAPAPGPAASDPQPTPAPTPAPAVVTPVSAPTPAPTPAVAVPAKDSGSSAAPGQVKKDDAKPGEAKKDDAKKVDQAPTAVGAPASSLAVSKSDDKTLRQLDKAPKHADRSDAKSGKDATRENAKATRHGGEDDGRGAHNAPAPSPPSVPSTVTTATPTTATTTTTTVPVASPPAPPPGQAKKSVPLPAPAPVTAPAAPVVAAPAPLPAPTAAPAATPPAAPADTGDRGRGDHGDHGDHGDRGDRPGHRR
jgi:RNA polymerase sigma-70 factor (ECF subfamily)